MSRKGVEMKMEIQAKVSEIRLSGDQAIATVTSEDSAVHFMLDIAPSSLQVGDRVDVTVSSAARAPAVPSNPGPAPVGESV